MEGVKKKMGCKAQVEVKYRSNLSVVRILTKPATKQTAFSSSPSHQIGLHEVIKVAVENSLGV